MKETEGNLKKVKQTDENIASGYILIQEIK